MTTATPIRTAAPTANSPDLAQLAAALSQARDVLYYLASRLDDPDRIIIRSCEKAALAQSVEASLIEIDLAQRLVEGGAP